MKVEKEFARTYVRYVEFSDNSHWVYAHTEHICEIRLWTRNFNVRHFEMMRIKKHRILEYETGRVPRKWGRIASSVALWVSGRLRRKRSGFGSHGGILLEDLQIFIPGLGVVDSSFWYPEGILVWVKSGLCMTDRWLFIYLLLSNLRKIKNK